MKDTTKTDSDRPPSMTSNRSGSPSIRARWSMRKYPPRVCANPQCQYGGTFEPYDKRQLYCCRQCGTDHRNDIRAEANRTTYAEERVLRETDNKLESLFEEYFNDKECLIHKDTLRLHKVDLRYSVTSEIRKATGMKTLWLYKFGTEQHRENLDFFYIIKRK